MAGTLRVTGGTLARRLIEVPPEADKGVVRPTSDRVREALFAALGSLDDTPLDGGRALDAFAGSGALGIEALSRGAAHVTFVERNKRVSATLKRNLIDLGLVARADVVVDDAKGALARLPDGAFELVLVDPPYQEPTGPLLGELARVMAPRGVLVIERDKRTRDPAPPGLSLLRERVYGSTRVTLWRRS